MMILLTAEVLCPMAYAILDISYGKGNYRGRLWVTVLYVF
jgi:hypothetical protein